MYAVREFSSGNWVKFEPGSHPWPVSRLGDATHFKTLRGVLRAYFNWGNMWPTATQQHECGSARYELVEIQDVSQQPVYEVVRVIE